MAPRRVDRSLVQKVLQIGAGKPGRSGRHYVEVAGILKRQVFRVNIEDCAPGGLVRQVQGYMAVKAPGPQQRRVQHVGTVGCRQHHHGLAPAEAVKLGQNLIERLLALVMAAAKASAAGSPDTVQLVDEDDRRRGLARSLEHLAHPAGADARQKPR